MRWGTEPVSPFSYQSCGDDNVSTDYDFESTPKEWARNKRTCTNMVHQKFGSWNVEGLGENMYKLKQVILHMQRQNILIMCIQETHVRELTVFKENGFLVILSGSTEINNVPFYAGVGFIVAPAATPAIIGYQLVSDRLANLRMKVKGGVLTIITAYAPHSGYKYMHRKRFFDELGRIWKPSRDHDCTLVLGDFNAKLYQKFVSDTDMLGDYVFVSPLPKKGYHYQTVSF